MAVTVAQFRADFPEFSSSTTFPTAQIQFWLTAAYNFVNAAVWGDSTDMGAELFTAHNIALEARAQQEAANGGVPGQQTGPINSKSVDKVSVGYDTGAGTEENGGHWNLTVYGTRFLRFAKLFGAVPLQIGIGYAPALNGPAWPGPFTTPGFSSFGT